MTEKQRFSDLTLLKGSENKYPHTPNEAQLEAFDNIYQDRDYIITFDCPEYTSLCPVTNQPDFGHIVIRYIPDKKCIES
ncbi:MAG: NADPH-dependent 7-cyano-7-deazaguanine reductase QueF, partial [Victivallales bacterium]|nr:NADPH-dependent 7-cyano-7-deazaguanine reductase QueF [Victivallales bacterium]